MSSRSLHPISSCTVSPRLQTPPRFNSILRAQLRAAQQEETLIEKAVSLLEERRLVVQARKGRAHNALQPCLRVPEEILSMIFEVAAPTPANAWPYCRSPITRKWYDWSLKEYESFLRSVGLTCSAFYSILLRNPRCWSFVDLTITSAKASTLLATLETRLIRSNPGLFDLFITTDLDEALIRGVDSQSLLLGRHLHRCRSVTIFNSGDFLTIPIVLLSSTPLCALAHVFVDYSGAEDGPRDIDYLLPATNATVPLLTLSINNWQHSDAMFAPAISRLHPSVTALTRLRLCGNFPNTCVIPLLRCCTALEHLEWTSGETSDEPDFALLELSCLKSLLIKGFTAAHELPPIRAPLLEQVGLLDMVENEETIISIFRPNQPHLPSLKRFWYRGALLPIDETKCFLQRHPTVEELCVESKHTPRSFFSFVDSILALTVGRQGQNSLRLSWLALTIGRYTRSIPNGDTNGIVVGALRRLVRNLSDARIYLNPQSDYKQEVSEIIAESPNVAPAQQGAPLGLDWPSAWMDWQQVQTLEPYTASQR